MGLVMTLDSKSIRFDFDKADIKPEYRDILNRIAGVLMTLKGFSIAVYGYTDDVGSQAYNLQLSQRRAEAVRDFLVQTGISPTILSTKGFGKSDPRVPGHSEQARAANRRVEIGIVDSKLITNGALVVPKRIRRYRSGVDVESGLQLHQDHPPKDVCRLERSKVTLVADALVASLVRRFSRPAAVASSNMLGFVPQRRTLWSNCEAKWRRRSVAPS